MNASQRAGPDGTASGPMPVSKDTAALTYEPRPPPHLLLVEDEELVSGMLIEFLADDFQVTCSADADSALRELGRMPVNIVLLDHMLPGGGSAAVAERAGRDGVPVVWMTGNPGAVAGLRGGSRHVIAKPFGLGELLALLVGACGPPCRPVA